MVGEVCQTGIVNQKGFARLVIIIVIGIAILFGFRVVSDDIFQGGAKEGNCQSKDVAKFDVEFTDLSKINAINPIGGVGGGSPGRSYIGILKGVEAPIFSPTDAVLENIIYAKRPVDPANSSATNPKGEYGLYFRLSCDVTFLFDHIDKVSDKILAVAPKEPSESSRVNNPPVNLPIKKGELLGYTDGTPQARTFDFLIIDMSKPTTHINPKRWEWEQAVYAQCPYDFFTPELKEKYYEHIGEVTEKSNRREFIRASGCGELSHDKLGTISGGWFKGASTDTKGDFMAIARPTKLTNRVDIAVKKDGLFGPDSIMHDYSPKVFPEDIKVGEDVCYYDQNEGKWAYVKLISETQLGLAKGSGNCPVTFPESQAETWER